MIASGITAVMGCGAVMTSSQLALSPALGSEKELVQLTLSTTSSVPFHVILISIPFYQSNPRVNKPCFVLSH